MCYVHLRPKTADFRFHHSAAILPVTQKDTNTLEELCDRSGHVKPRVHLADTEYQLRTAAVNRQHPGWLPLESMKQEQMSLHGIILLM
jgi:hypothetical protein